MFLRLITILITTALLWSLVMMVIYFFHNIKWNIIDDALNYDISNWFPSEKKKEKNDLRAKYMNGWM
jgi:hypothetical protein